MRGETPGLPTTPLPDAYRRAWRLAGVVEQLLRQPEDVRAEVLAEMSPTDRAVMQVYLETVYGDEC